MHTDARVISGGRRNGGMLALAVLIGLRLTTATVGQTPATGGGDASVQIPPGATVESLFTDFLHYAKIGRFKIANAYAEALLAHPDLDPVEVLEIARRDKKSIHTLTLIVEHSSIGENAKKVLDLIDQGAHAKRRDEEQILHNIELLGGDPQQEYVGLKRLRESGEYAIPAMVQVLLDTSKSKLVPRVAGALTRMGKDAVTPMVMALAVRALDVRLHLIHALGEMGYPQAVPYLQKLLTNDALPPELVRATLAAVERIEALSGRSVAVPAEVGFYRLAQQYFEERDAVRPESNSGDVNAWYWDDDLQALRRVVVPEHIYGPLMAMRCCEEALLLRNDYADAIALWLAANTRREARMGLDVESGEPAEGGDPDPTRPNDFPRALYFSQAAGPRYAHRMLARAIRANDAAVALGAIKALRITAGASSLVGSEDIKQPLVQALRFPDRVVRIRAALALGAALPRSWFADSEFVVPVLATAINLTGREQVIVVDPDEGNLNRVMDGLRAGGRQVIGEASFYRAMDRARSEFQSLDGVFIASDCSEPTLPLAVTKLRGEFLFAKTPVVVLTKPEQSLSVEQVVQHDPYAEAVDAAAEKGHFEAALARVRARSGQIPVNDKLALSLAMEAVDTLRRIAIDGRTVYNVNDAESALIAALSASNEQLQTASAEVLALVRTPSAQRAIAAVALDTGNSESLRIAAFDSLARSAKRHGNMLTEGQLSDLVVIARDEKDLVLRTAASQALGAANLSSNKASELIRSYYGG